MKGRLTFCEDGRWGINGMNKDNESDKMYAVSEKLKDYENLGLNPDEVECVIEFAKTMGVKFPKGESPIVRKESVERACNDYLNRQQPWGREQLWTAGLCRLNARERKMFFDKINQEEARGHRISRVVS